MLYSRDTTIRIHIHAETINNNDKRTHFFRKTYLSHCILERVAKGLCVRGELETEQTATYWPQVPLTIVAPLSHSAGLLNQGSLRAASPLSGAGSHCLSNFNCNWLELTQTICGIRLYNCLLSTCFLWASQLHWIQPVHRSRWYPDIFDRMHLLFTQVHLLIDSSVECQYVTTIINGSTITTKQKWEGK